MLVSKRQVVANSFWLISEKGIRFLLGFLILALVARHLGLTLFGELNFAIAVYSILSVVASAGANRITIRESAENSSNFRERQTLVSSVFFFRLVTAAFLFLFSAIAAFHFYDGQTLLFLIVVSSVLFHPFEVLDLHQQGLARVRRVTIVRTAVFFFSSALKASTVLLDQSPVWIFILVLSEFGAVAIWMYLSVGFESGQRVIRMASFSIRRLKVLLLESWPEVLAGLSGILFVRLDQIMLRFMEGADSVGMYSAAARISEAWYFVPAAIIATSFPKIIELKASSREAYLGALSTLISVIVFLSLMVAFLFLVFSESIISLVFGPDYTASAAILQIHCFSAIFVFLGAASGSWLAVERKLILNLYRNAFGLVVNVLLNYLLISIYGPVGAAIATLVAVACAYFLFDVFSKQLRFMFFMKTRALFSLGVAGLVKLGRFK